MNLIATGLTSFVAILHLGFFYGESFAWSTMGRRFGLSADEVEITRSLAQNQGAYNGALAGLLIWAMATGNDSAAIAVLVVVALMGVVGAATASGSILVIQTLPAVLAIIARLLFVAPEITLS